MVMISYARRLPNLAYRRGWRLCGARCRASDMALLGVVAGAEGRSRALVGAPINPIGAPNTRGRTPPPPLLTQRGCSRCALAQVSKPRLVTLLQKGGPSRFRSAN